MVGSLGVTETRETSHQDKGDDHVHVEKAVLSPVGDVKTGLSVYFIRLAIWQVKKNLFYLQTPGYGTAD